MHHTTLVCIPLKTKAARYKKFLSNYWYASQFTELLNQALTHLLFCCRICLLAYMAPLLCPSVRWKGMINSVKTVHMSLHIIFLLQLDSAHNIQVKALLLEFQQQANYDKKLVQSKNM